MDQIYVLGAEKVIFSQETPSLCFQRNYRILRSDLDKNVFFSDIRIENKKD